MIVPGSLYTSVLAACVVPGIREALKEAPREVRQRVYIANLREQVPETAGYDVADHLRALGRHGIGVGTVVADSKALALGDIEEAARGVSVRMVPVAGRVSLLTIRICSRWH